MRRYLFSMLLCWTSLVFADPLMSKVITLHYQQANAVIQLIQPLLGPDDKVSGNDQTLVLKVSPDTLTSIREVVQKVDVPPVVFKILVFQGNKAALDAVDGTTIVYSTQPSDMRKRYQMVQVMSGESAFVNTGSDVPVVSSVGVGLWTGVNYERQFVDNGFLLEPSLEGEKVKLAIKRIQQRVSQQGNSQFDSQAINTTVLIDTDTWVPLGTSEGADMSDDEDNGNAISISTGDRFSQNSTLYVKVMISKKSASGVPKD